MAAYDIYIYSNIIIITIIIIVINFYYDIIYGQSLIVHIKKTLVVIRVDLNYPRLGTSWLFTKKSGWVRTLYPR